jgi:SAM-dependent methyltransferase
MNPSAPAPAMESQQAAPKRILNVGCGTDEYGTHRMDFVPAPNVTEVGSVLQLPYRDGVFDEVFGANILEHMGNPMAFLQECVRVLRPGGKLVMVTDHAGYIGYQFVGWRAGDNHQWHGAHKDRHFMLYSRGHLANFAEVLGLDVESVSLYTKWKQGFRARVIGLFFPHLVAAQIRLEARKPKATT